MNITLQYGKKGLAIHLPDDWDVTVIRKKPMPVLPDPQAALEQRSGESCRFQLSL